MISIYLKTHSHKEIIMEHIGKNIERMQELIQTPVNPPPS